MALPSAYLTSFKNVPSIFAAIQTAQAPPRFTQKFLENLGFANANDRMMINVLKALGMLDDTGVPTRRYHEYLDQTQSAQVLARGIKAAYQDLFRVNTRANDMPQGDVKNKMKTLSEGLFTDRVLTQMAGTFNTLCKLADFSGSAGGIDAAIGDVVADDAGNASDASDEVGTPGAEMVKGARIGGLVYSINLILPESRDQAVYDVLFKSLKMHLLS